METIYPYRENYHTHTYLCHHAEGTVREYVESAIAGGYRVLGFSDHAPYTYGGVYDSFFRMFPCEMDAYISELLALRAEFKDKIDIKIGYEAEYYPEYFDALIERVCAYPCDYLILGQHFTKNEYDGEYAGNHGDEAAVSEYVRQVCCGMRTGLYSFVAHPDLVNFNGGTERYLELTRDICRTSLETDTPLEINLYGIIDRRDYPKECFWQMAGEYGCKVVLGVDAHSSDRFLCRDDVSEGFELIRKYGLNYVESPTLRAPRDVLSEKSFSFGLTET